jgi:hypothetical protein
MNKVKCMMHRCSAANPAGTLILQPLALQFSATDTPVHKLIAL